ncbi:hypothetical protein F4808DRAFT_461780 [Astrocystis sublimbata]|nr:hypothetical protein F4808DRAFT_461780 [Astrocystis sublimbata]
MPDVDSQLEFLSENELYKTQRPFIFTPSQQSEHKVDTRPSVLNTIELGFEAVKLQDIRGREHQFVLKECGFEIANHESEFADFRSLTESREARAKYHDETEDFLRKRFNAIDVICYSIKLRHNGEWDPTELVDLESYGWLEPPARGVHDVSFDQAPTLIVNELKYAKKEQYLKPGYRYQIVNTWRPFNSPLEDNPLAVCDSRSVQPSDLVICDRILPNEDWTLYFLKYHPKQQWYWFSKQTSADVALMLIYDTLPEGARCE